MTFDIDASTANQINTTLCNLAGINVSAELATECSEFGTMVLFPDGSTGTKVSEFPVGVSCVTYNAVGGSIIPAMGGTGSGAGSATPNDPSDDFTFGEPGIPIECKFNVTVTDDEAPVFVCPEDRTFNLQSGECCEIVDFTVFATDNCDDMNGECLVMSAVTFDGCDPGLAGGSTFDQIQFDVTNNGNATIVLQTMYQPVFAAGTYSWNVHTTPGGFTGNSLNAAAWTLVNTPVATTYTAGQIAALPLNTPITLAPGATVGVALSFPLAQSGSFGLSYVFNTCTTPVNPNGLTISAGVAPQFQFGGVVLNPRSFAGFFDYSIDVGASSGFSDEITQISGLMPGDATV